MLSSQIDSVVAIQEAERLARKRREEIEIHFRNGLSLNPMTLRRTSEEEEETEFRCWVKGRVGLTLTFFVRFVRIVEREKVPTFAFGQKIQQTPF